jgi:glycosyltransferase involved in cell wall biosynthesis
MRVLILGGSNSRNSGGIFDAARTLGLNLHKYFKVDAQFLMHDDEYSAKDRLYYEKLPLHSYKVIGFRNLGFSLDMYRHLASVRPDVVHTHSIWMYLSYVNKKYNSATGTPYIITPHGMLDPWQLKQSVLKKKLVLALYERRHMQQASCIQALCKDEYDAIRGFGLKTPVAIIPNGVDLPAIEQGKKNHAEPGRWNKGNYRRTLLFLSRIHVKKGLDNLLQAWARTKPEQHNWQLVIAGETKDEAYMQSLFDAARNLNINDTVQFIGGQFGKHKKTCFMDADAFILPSFSEGLPMAVLEAWSYKLPAVLTPFCNLPEGFSSGAAIRIETEVDSIAAGIQSLIGMSDEERRIIGQNGYDLVKEKFTLEQVARATMHMYEWVTGKKEKPDFVFND